MKFRCMRFLVPTLGLLLAQACGGGRAVGDKAGAASSMLQITPAEAQLAPGQSLQLSVQGSWAGGLRWAVVPSTGGTVSSTGLFTASSNQGLVQIVAVWNQDVRYAATAMITILPPPLPAQSTPALISASGNAQGSLTGTIRNTALAGEGIPATTASDTTQLVTVHHGFSLAVH